MDASNTAVPLRATGRVVLAAPQAAVDEICTMFAEHAEIRHEAAGVRIESVVGAATLVIEDGALAIRAEAPDATGLAYVKMAIADYFTRRPDAAGIRLLWSDSVAGGTPPPFLRAMEVVGAETVTPHMRRVRLRGEDMGRFAHGGLHVRLLLPRTPGVRPAWPILAEDGRLTWPETGERPQARVYTIRRIDVAAGLVEIDFVLHPGQDMPGATFGATAQPGDVVGMTGPGGGDVAEADWHLLVGDETALPAIARALERMPAGRKVVALVEVADAGERQEIATKADLDLRWFHRDGRPAGTTTLLSDAVRDVAFPTGGERVHVFAGCEHAEAKAIRKHLRQERGLSRTEHLVAAYWRVGVAGEE